MQEICRSRNRTLREDEAALKGRNGTGAGGQGEPGQAVEATRLSQFVFVVETVLQINIFRREEIA